MIHITKKVKQLLGKIGSKFGLIKTHIDVPRSRTFIVAASDSLHPERADYVCDGVDDQEEIQAAIDAAYAIGGRKVALTKGTYYYSTITI